MRIPPPPHLVWAAAVIQLMFIIFKFLNVIEWSWWSVFIPLWVFIGIFIIVFLLELLK